MRRWRRLREMGCIFGHNCHFTRSRIDPRDRIKRRLCLDTTGKWAGKCLFLEEARDMDFKVVTSTYYHIPDRIV